MAFRKKADAILAHQPDILLVQECEHPDKIDFTQHKRIPKSMLWFGNNPHKGMGIFAYSDYSLKLHQSYNETIKWVVPIVVGNGLHRYTLFAVWAHNPQDPDGQYVTQVWKATKHYQKLIKKTNTILMGDFNSNTIWDKPKREGNHSTVVAHLKAKNIHSVYHQHFNQMQGTEKHPTFYLYRHKAKPYHLDYCFASGDWIEKLSAVEIGHFRTWKKYSDHVPLMVSFEPMTVDRGPWVVGRNSMTEHRGPKELTNRKAVLIGQRLTNHGQRPFLL
jgi:exodeoxyribonuclease III